MPIVSDGKEATVYSIMKLLHKLLAHLYRDLSDVPFAFSGFGNVGMLLQFQKHLGGNRKCVGKIG